MPRKCSVVLLTASLIFLDAGCFLFKTHPSDAELLVLFEEHEAQFTELKEMILEDPGLICVKDDFFLTKDSPLPVREPGSKLTQTRWDKYRRLMRLLNLDTGVCRPSNVGEEPGRAVYFYVSSRGFVFSGDSKGIVFTEEKPYPSYASLDGNRAVDTAFAFRALTDNWYIFFRGG